MNSLNSTLRISELKKAFGRNRVLTGVTTELQAGQITLLLGSNGAGKSTLMRILAGLLRPDSGSVSWSDKGAPPIGAVGYAAHDSLLYRKLCVGEYLSMCASLCRRCAEPLEVVLQRWNIKEHEEQLIENLSRGVQARVSLCRSMMFTPEFILLDEPSSNLDDASMEVLSSSVQEAAKSGAVVAIATHDLARFGPLAERALILHQGSCFMDSSDLESCQELYDEYRKVNR